MIGLTKAYPFPACHLMSMPTASGFCNSIVNVQTLVDPYMLSVLCDISLTTTVQFYYWS